MAAPRAFRLDSSAFWNSGCRGIVTEGNEGNEDRSLFEIFVSFVCFCWFPCFIDPAKVTAMGLELPCERSILGQVLTLASGEVYQQGGNVRFSQQNREQSVRIR